MKEISTCDVLHYVTTNKGKLKKELIELVKAESPSHDKAALLSCEQKIKQIITGHFGDQFTLETFGMDETGNHLKYEIRKQPGPRILFLSHYDTVWRKGELPVAEKKEKIYGPGIFDMKAGLLCSIWAVKALLETRGKLLFSPVFLFTADEEIGSITSKAIIETVAETCDAVFVMEPPTSRSHALKLERKGVGAYTITATGKSAHAGNHHAEGVSAILEMSKIIQKLEGLTDYKKGTTINVGKINGGSVSNVIPEKAEIEVDFRVKNSEEAKRIETVIESLSVSHPEIDLLIEGGLNRPPLEKTAGNAALFAIAKRAGKKLGMKVKGASAGGGSDGNFTSALGIPTLDGLGIPGGGPHARSEHIRFDLFPQKCALVALVCELFSEKIELLK
ncbi:M20 family metallopeptidase [Oceanobacillus alkalisoli]|uniref:M20 family metallopeptidase n=1 Tax=Oceanobacillus alkalisoli TaxID=2925113 RepID=UPI001EF15ADC|nr:M20 family metallopeptidase [Oceanobacillus alkalisoli]MCF3944582.1 M20 family metallopeptidase [Oceanobacillus alkalisoli]MCG5102192.1 M20 family metallopeptidase [Oceanobacillus alkalisoli]